MNVSEVIDDDYKEIERIGSAVPLGQKPAGGPCQSRRQDGLHLQRPRFRGRRPRAPTMRAAGDRQGVRPAQDAGMGPRQDPVQHGLPADDRAALDRLFVVSSRRPDRRPGLAQPRGTAQDAGLVRHGAHAPAALVGRPRRGAGLRVHDPRPADAGPRSGRRPDQAEAGFQAGRTGREHWPAVPPDLDALAIYSNSFEFTFLSPHIPAPGKLSEAAQRGKTLFFSKAVGCADCHSGPYYTDSSLQKPFKLHDVGTGKDDPREKMGPKYDTPTLLGVYRTAPYLHHGKAKTLRDVLTTCNKEDKHGKTSHLQPDELDDLVEFLKSLPYE